MKILFTKSDKIGSKLIRRGLDEPVSHVAIVFFNKTVLHATFSGVVEVSLYEFMQHNEVIYELEYSMDFKKELYLYEKSINKLEGDSYDKMAFAYFALAVLRRKLFGIPLPKTNPWNTQRAEICTEIAASVLGLENVDASMTSPYQLYMYLKENRNG